jgi:TatA/E family protein of Tat protein translocase
MDFFGIGPGELLLIIIIALIIFGPGRIVEVSRQLGRTVRAFRKASSELTAQISRELENEDNSPLTHQDGKSGEERNGKTNAS